MSKKSARGHFTGSHGKWDRKKKSPKIKLVDETEETKTGAALPSNQDSPILSQDKISDFSY